MAEEPTKPKRGSIIRRRRAGSMKSRPASMSGTNASGCQRTQSEKCTSTDVSILVTEASPEGGKSGDSRPLLRRQNSEATVVQVLVHRESEEYNNDDEDENSKHQSQQEDTSQITESSPALNGVQTINRARRSLTTNDASAGETTTTDDVLALDNILATGGTMTDVVIDIDSNMSS